MDVFAKLAAQRFLPIIRTSSAEAALQLGHEVLAGGVDCLEVTFTIPGAADVLRALAGQGRCLGAGTLRNAAQAKQAVAAGAAFLVSPSDVDDVRAIAKDHGLPYIPGVLTPNEVERALGKGDGLLKLFPARAVSPSYLRDLGGPYPEARFLPTGGITPEAIEDWLEAGAVAVGLGGNLFAKPEQIRRVAAGLKARLQIPVES